MDLEMLHDAVYACASNEKRKVYVGVYVSDIFMYSLSMHSRNGTQLCVHINPTYVQVHRGNGTLLMLNDLLKKHETTSIRIECKAKHTYHSGKKKTYEATLSKDEFASRYQQFIKCVPYPKTPKLFCTCYS